MTLLPELHDFSDIKESPRAFNTLTKLFGPVLAAQQLALEHESYELGETRWLNGFKRALKDGEVSETQTAKPVLSALVPRFVERFGVWLEHQETKVRRKHVAIDVFRKVDPEVAAVVTIKRVLNILAGSAGSASPATIQRVAIGVGKSLEEEMRYGRIRREEAEHFRKHVQPALAKRNGELYKREYLKAVEGKMTEAGQLKSGWEEWAPDKRFQVGVKLLEILIESSELIEVKRLNKGNKSLDGEYVSLHPDWIKKLRDRSYNLAGIDPLYQPCVVPPKRWTGITGGGYWARGRAPLSLVRMSGRRARERYGDVHMPEVIKAVNLAQETAWRINTKVLAVVNELAKWEHVPIEDFPDLSDEPMPEGKPADDAEEQTMKAWKREAAKVHRRAKARDSRRLRMEFLQSQANKFADYEAIYFPYNMDWRGRVYAIPSMNPQGNDMTKGLLMAAHGEPIGAEGRMWLAVHGANCAGVDKVDFADRLAWVAENEKQILEVANDPCANRWWMQQDSPFCFLAFCFEWAGVQRDGDAYVCGLPIAFDGSCSGIQHFSAMLRDERGGKAVNLVPSETVQDIYRLVADEVVKLLEVDLKSGTEDGVKLLTDADTGEIREVRMLGTKSLAKGWMEYEITRKVTKRSVMTLPYGSKEFGFSQQLLEDIIRPAVDKGLGHMFLEPSQSSRYLASLIWSSVSVVVVAAVQAMAWLQAAAKLMATEVKIKGEVVKPCLPVFWVTPDGFPVWQEYYKPNKRQVDLMFLGSHRMKSMVVTGNSDKLDPRKQEAGVSPNFVHSQDGNHLRQTVVKAHEVYGVTFFALIHDSFGTIPAKAGAMFRAVREAMVETYSNNDVLEDFRDQFMEQLHVSQLDKMPNLPTKGTLDINLILESKFAFA